MPEGDTIFRAARTLNRALAGRAVTLFETQLPQLSRVDYDTPLVGRTVERVDSTGKWVRMYFSGDLILLTHMLMSGSWHIYRPGERWQRPRADMRVAVHTDGFVAVGFRIPVAEFHTAATLERHRSTQLGPDVLAAEFDEQRAFDSLRRETDLEIGEALLRQSVLAGLGNVYKSEVCFVSGVHPFRATGSVTNDEIRTLLSNARTLMLANVAPESGGGIVTYAGLRRTTRRADPSQRLWVYKRAGEPCRRCGAVIASRKQGVDARITFWCPECQPFNGLQRAR